MHEVWFIRHGKSEANAGGKTSDYGKIALTEEGEWQAVQVRGNIKQELIRARKKPDLILMSPYYRALQTALPTLNIRSFKDIINREHENLREFTYLNLKNASPTNADDREPFAQEYWTTLDPIFTDGGHESFFMLVQRVQREMEYLKSLADESLTLAFCHVNVMQVVSLLSRLEKEEYIKLKYITDKDQDDLKKEDIATLKEFMQDFKKLARDKETRISIKNGQIDKYVIDGDNIAQNGSIRIEAFSRNEPRR